MKEKFGKLFNRKGNIAYTHNGIFHADDVCSAALLEIFFPGIEILRVSSVPVDAELAFDIGYGKYDHHQPNPELRPDGNPYAAFGLLWKDLGPLMTDDENTKVFDDVFVKSIDYTDNTGYPNPFSSVIKAFNPVWDSEESQDECFKKAVGFAKTAINKQLERFESAVEADEIVKELMGDPKNHPTPSSLLLENYIPYQRVVVQSDITFVIYPSNRQEGHWNLSSVPETIGGKASKMLLPEEWVNNPPEGCVFIHNGHWLATFESKVSAINAVKIIDTEYPCIKPGMDPRM